ncbi:monooxygenase [Streptomyces sp. YC504]|uniref:Monooxygenase n=1 Tax=Streptomyces mesophilus TaxID=1775132 RepID=A0A6G4XAV5_9ACTN|nr:monooxygenase [Streptomyces mesophilus]
MTGARAAVVGGSIAGCAAALALHRAGAQRITVYEQAHEDLARRGVGVGVHNKRHTELRTAGYLGTSTPWLQLSRRTWFVRDATCPDPMGRSVATDAFPFRMYHWGRLWRELREQVPDTVTFRTGARITGVHAQEREAVLHTKTSSHAFDLVVGADGHRSVVRAAAFPRTQLLSAGYLAWRGVLRADRMPRARRWPADTCAYVVFREGHLFACRVPGPPGSDGPQINWVLYSANQSAGTGHAPGEVLAERGACQEAAEETADALLPPFWAELVHLTEPRDFLVQPIGDLLTPSYVQGRLVLIGDAAACARPHVAAGAVKALQDAAVLERALGAAGNRPWHEALQHYNTARTGNGNAVIALGRRFGETLVTEAPDWASHPGPSPAACWQQCDPAGEFGGLRLPA